ncbi:MAG: hypothetical protein KUG52_04715 [Immundisolibacteraceae bacterium]|nr:hypothetical protein [Immundisolibacteraceae bacterium]
MQNFAKILGNLLVIIDDPVDVIGGFKLVYALQQKHQFELGTSQAFTVIN